MSVEEARAYVERWQLVSETELVELRASPIELKLRQLAALMEARNFFPAEPNREQEVERVRERWALLRRSLSA